MVWIILGIIALIVIIVIGIYNNLVQLKMRVRNAWAQIDTQLKRRFDLIPNLVETVKGYKEYEQETLEKVIEARNKYVSADGVEDKAAATNMLNASLKSIFALAEAYPDLKANKNFENLQMELSSTEDKIAYARQFYNDTVQMYNTAILSFPSNMIAGMFNFTSENFFEIEDASQKEPVKVQF
ncbi:MAG: LemA family protein [Clostridia bacterium]|nr:LemA family protein [Clostridia bacterium]